MTRKTILPGDTVRFKPGFGAKFVTYVGYEVNFKTIKYNLWVVKL